MICRLSEGVILSLRIIADFCFLIEVQEKCHQFAPVEGIVMHVRSGAPAMVPREATEENTDTAQLSPQRDSPSA